MSPAPAYPKSAKSAKAPGVLLPLLPSYKGSPSSVRGTVILVTLCFVAVLGIALASYLAVCSRAMQLSNRNFQADLSKQLAEAGIEEGLRAFNKNNWDSWTSGSTSVVWDTTTYASDKRAVGTITFPSSKLGQGVTAAVKVRVDNYDAQTVGTSWSNSKSYKIGDVVGYGGMWYRCVQNHSNQTPSPLANLAYWVPAPIPWAWCSDYSYKLYDVVNYNSTWYRCTTAHTSTSSWDATKWTSFSSIKLYSASDFHAVNDVVYNPDATTWYRCTAAGTPGSFSATAQVSWQYLSTTTYNFNDVVCYYTGGAYNWYRCKVATSSAVLPTNTTNWENALSGSWSWSSSATYNLGDVVNVSGNFYRCIRTHTNQTPPSANYWSAEPPYSTYWDSGRNYGANDVVRYRGSWYLSLSGSNAGNRPGVDATYWAVAPRSIEPWSSTKAYHIDDLVTSSSNWYRCIKDHSNQAVSSGTYWVQVAGSSNVWSANTAYSSGAYRSYGGVWYKSIAATTANAGHTPNNTTYWTAAWSQYAGATTGAPIIYAEATLTLGDRTTSKTQLRVVVDPAPLFPNAAGATTTVTITSGTGTVDSYDSELPDSSDADGDNYVAANAGYSAVLAAGTGSASGTSTLLSVAGTTTVKGYAAAPSSSSSPYAPRASFGSSVTLKAATSAASPNVDTAQVSRSPYIPQFDIQTPIQQTSIPTSLPNGSTYPLNLGTPGAPTPSVYYFSTNLNIAASEKVNINGPVILRINGYLRCNTGTFNVTSAGSVVAYFPYILRNEASSGGFQNLSKDPKNMLFINTSTTSPTTTTYFIAPSGSSKFYGAVYMPNTTATLGFDVRTGNEIFGALSAREITFSTEANLHYDTSLRYATFTGVDQPYTVTNWTELSTTEQATMP